MIYILTRFRPSVNNTRQLCLPSYPQACLPERCRDCRTCSEVETRHLQEEETHADVPPGGERGQKTGPHKSGRRGRPQNGCHTVGTASGKYMVFATIATQSFKSFTLLSPPFGFILPDTYFVSCAESQFFRPKCRYNCKKR